MCSGDIFLGLLAILFPPIAVWIKVGICSADSIINILLCMLGYIPGLLHAWYIISLYPEPSEDEYEYTAITTRSDPERGYGAPGQQTSRDANGRVMYYYVDNQGQGQSQGQQQAQRGYGTVSAPASSQQQQQPQQYQQGQSSTTTANNTRVANNDDVAPQGVPPSYEQAIQGDNKVQK